MLHLHWRVVGSLADIFTASAFDGLKVFSEISSLDMQMSCKQTFQGYFLDEKKNYRKKLFNLSHSLSSLS